MFFCDIIRLTDDFMICRWRNYMKNWMKITLGVVGVILLLLIIDLLCIFTINKPLLAVKQDNGDSVNIVYRGLLYDTYICH